MTSVQDGSQDEAAKPSSDRDAAVRGASFWRPWLVTFVAFILVGTAWSLAQPIFAGADEPQHAQEGQAVWSGQFLPPLTRHSPNQIEPGIQHIPVLPAGPACFDAHPAVSASCDHTSLHGAAREGDVVNYISREPPLPALLTGLPLYLAPNRTGFYLSRFLTSLEGAALLATAVALAASRRRPVLLLGVLVAATPSVVAEFGVLGSSQLEVGSALVLWVCVTLLLTGERVGLPVAGIMTGSFVLLLLSRPASIGYAALALVVFLLCAKRATLRQFAAASWFVPMVLTAGVVLLFALWWLVFAEAPTNATYLTVNHLPHITNWSARISFALGYQIDFWDQMIGAVGTNEYSGPAWLLFVWTMLAGALVFPAVVVTTRRLAAALLGLLAVLLALPVAAQAYYVSDVYLTWMGRYDLPVFVGLIVLAAGVLDHRLRRPEVRRLLALGITLIALLQAVAFAGTIRRYAVGINGTVDPFQWAHGWRPPLVGPLGLLLLGCGLIAAAYGALWWMGRQVSEVASPPTGDAATAQEYATATGLPPAGSVGSAKLPASP